MEVINCSFNDVYDPENWSPDDLFDFEEWITVTVGDEKGGSNFQLHVCTPVSVSRLEPKRHIFMIDRWEGVPKLIEKLNDFIQRVEAETTSVLEHELAKHWAWEYGGM